jgi:hypothetical protein
LCPIYNSFPCLFGGEISSFFKKEIGIYFFVVNSTKLSLFLGEISSKFQYPKNEKNQNCFTQGLRSVESGRCSPKNSAYSTENSPKKFNEFQNIYAAPQGINIQLKCIECNE